MFDYGDALTLEADLANMCLGVAEDPDNPLVERRQCLLLHVAAGALGARSGVLPSRHEAQDLGARMRRTMLERAQGSKRALGEAP
eukprot:1386262-Heterocapsa_arctica.AAC.1